MTEMQPRGRQKRQRAQLKSSFEQHQDFIIFQDKSAPDKLETKINSNVVPI